MWKKGIVALYEVAHVHLGSVEMERHCK